MLLFVRSFVRVFVRSFVHSFVSSSEARLEVSEAKFEVSVASQPTAGARIFGPVGP